MPATLSSTTRRLLDELPPFEQSAYAMQAALAAIAGELDRLRAAVEEVLTNFYPQRGDRYLKLWESLLGITVEPPDKTLAQRRATAVAFYSTLSGSGSARSWVDMLTRYIGTAWSYEEHDPADPQSPPANSVRIYLPYSPPAPPPSGLAATAATTGGTLTAGTYFYAVTTRTAYGETDASRVSITTTGNTSRVTLTWNAVAGAEGYVIYRGTASGEELRLTEVSAATYTDSGAEAGTTRPPSSNQSGAPQAYEAEQLARQATPAHIDLIVGYSAGFIVGVSIIGEEPI